MSRATRRHPIVETQPKPRRVARPAPAPRSVPAARRRGSLLKPQWVQEIWSELKKVQWPTRQEAINLTIVVIVVSAVVGLVLGGIDLGFTWVIEHTVLR